MASSAKILLLPFFLIATTIISRSNVHAQLLITTNFYRNTCPNLESIVRNAVQAKFNQTFAAAPGTLRLFFHDCVVRGCDASILIASPENKAEKDDSDNLSLGEPAFDTVIKAKAAVDSDPQCTNKVSCADILALATREVVSLVGGPFYEVELGRRDGRISTIASVQGSLPKPEFNFDQLNTLFSDHGLSTTDLVALSGAHTIGRTHCIHFSKRLYNYSSETRVDPTINPKYVPEMMIMCPENVDTKVMVNMDSIAPHQFDNFYYKSLKQGMGLFASDQVLFTDLRSKAIVNRFASSNAAFRQAFVTAITKLGRVGVLTGNQGEIRRDCTAPNSD